MQESTGLAYEMVKKMRVARFQVSQACIGLAQRVIFGWLRM